MAVAIVTDTVACLPPEIIDKYQITVVPLEIIHKGKVYKDGIDISPAKFYEILSNSDVLPTTTAPSPEVYLEVYEKIIDQDNDVLVICPSKKLTHVYESASIAAKMLKEKISDAVITVLDSGTAAGAQGFVVNDVAKVARYGKRLTDILNIAQQIMKEVHVLVFLDTLAYLARSGRVPYVLAWANSLIKIRPVIELLPLGKGVTLVERARSRYKAMDRVLEILKRRTKDLPLRVVVQHTNSQEDAEMLAKQVKLLPNCSQVDIRDFTSVMGVHTGPGLVGVSYSTYRTLDVEK